jgi:hypothetical protein
MLRIEKIKGKKVIFFKFSVPRVKKLHLAKKFFAES